MPNYKWVPIGYHGRASSITVSGHDFRRPVGQTLPQQATSPVVGPCKRLDYELELAIYVGTGNALGAPIGIDAAESHVFGIGILNDWSARDIQTWEYQPLGPFLAKNFASTISPWIVTLEALASYRVPFERPAGDPQPLPYLNSARQRTEGALDIQLELSIETAQGGKQPFTLGNGETRTFLEDGDAVVIRAWAEKQGAARIGSGECRATALPAWDAV